MKCIKRERKGINFIKRRLSLVLAIIIAVVLGLGACNSPRKENTILQNPVEYQSDAEDLTDEIPVEESSEPEYKIETNNKKQTEVMENLFTTIYPHDWQNAYAEYLKNINFNPVHFRSIYIKDINSDEIPEIIIIYTGDLSNCEILSFVDGNLEVMNLSDVQKIYYKEDTFQLIVYSADGFSSGRRDYYQVYDLIENNYKLTLNFGVTVVADPDSYNDGEYDLYYTYTINDDYIDGEHQPENEIDEHQFNKLLLEIESLKSDAELLKLTYEDLNGGFEVYIEEMLFN